MKKAIITGITGQDGAYLSQLLLNKGYEVTGFVRNINNFQKDKLIYLGISDELIFRECSLSDLSSVMGLVTEIEPDEIYNLAAQSSVGISFKEPISTIQVNSQSVLTILEAIRIINPRIKFYQASSSEMYGNINSLPITESSVMHPVSPYAISKATAYWSTICYRESYSLFACNGILFNHESYLRGSTFFVKKVIQSAISIKNNMMDKMHVGNLMVKRDFGYARDYVEVMYKLMQHNEPDDFVICSGTSVQLKDIVYYVFDSLNVDRDKIIVDKNLLRPNEIPDIWGDNSKAKTVLKWNYNKSFFDVLDILIDEELINYKKP